MRTDLHHTKHADPETVGRTLTDTLLLGRAALPLAANNKPTKLSKPYAQKVAEEMSQGRSQEFKRIFAVCQCMLADRVPLPLVTAALRQMLTMLEVESAALAAERVSSTPRVLPILLRQETRAQGHLDLAQLRVLETPECPNALGDALHAGAKYLSAYQPWAKALVGLLHTTKHVPQDGLRIMR
jgi:hypothetical protein